MQPTPGYSGTPLFKKLGLKPGASARFIGAPEGFAEGFADLRHEPPHDVTVIFAAFQYRLVAEIPEAMASLKKDGGLWLCWPKKSSRVPTDVTENLLRDLFLPTGMVDNKVCAVTDVWSGLRFVWRKDRRS